MLKMMWVLENKETKCDLKNKNLFPKKETLIHIVQQNYRNNKKCDK